MAQRPRTYQSNIPMVPAVPGTTLPARCREIRRGDVMTDDDLVLAEKDIRAREALLREDMPSVDIEKAKKRKLAIMMEQVTAEYQPEGPAWAVRLVRDIARLSGDVNQIRQDVNGISGDVNQIRQDVNQLREDLNAVLDASIESVNGNNQRKNYRISNQPNPGQIPLHSYRNPNRRLGAPLSGRPQPAAPPVLPAFGATIPSPPFPRNIDDANNFTMDQIEALSMVLNHDFGIVAEDPLDVCVRKMKEYLFLTMR